MSSICTPKKLKTTWSTLLKNVGDTGDVNLERLLEEEDPDHFSQTSERCQRALLCDILGDDSDLVDRVIESIRVGKKEPETAVNLLKSYKLAPSKIYVSDQLEVASALFNSHFLLLDYFKTYAATGEAPPPDKPPPVERNISVNNVPLFYQKMRILHVGLRIREAAGIPLLGYCMTSLCETLNELKKDQRFRVHSEYPVVKEGKNQSAPFSSHITITATATDNQEEMRPIFLCEYKPVVDMNCSDVPVNDLLEAFVQGYYCLHSRKMESILHCITDLSRWHYFKLRYVRQCLKIEWTKTFIYDQPIPRAEDVKRHYSYLISIL